MSGARPSSFGVLLRRYREAAGLSQEDLAERAALAAKAIGALERGERRRPYPRTVQLLADALRLDDAQRRELIASVPRSPSVAATAEVDGLVGRERELGELTAKLRAASGGHGGIVMLVGEAGIGKTRLAHEVMAIARAQGTAVLSGRALEGDGQAPYGPWVEAIEGHIRERARADLAGDLGPDAAYIAELVPSLRPHLTDASRPEQLAPNDERLRLFGAVTRFCSTVAGSGTALVVLDDLHWADRDTLGLMRYMARTLTTSRVLIVGAYRDPEVGVDASHPLHTTLAAIRHEIACPSIRLDGLRSDEMRTYLNQAAGQSLPPAFVERVGQETSGNPFYAREVLRHVSEAQEGWPSVEGGRPFAMTGVPEGVRQVVADRVRRLSPPTAQALRDACAFTGGFAFPVLHHLTTLSEGALLDCLDEAVAAGLLRAPGADEREYEFEHAIVRHALYEAQSRDRRVRLHRRIATALQSAYPERADEHAADVAAHYFASAELPGASAGLPYALAAADRARAAFAHDRVLTLLRMASDLAVEAGTAARLEILMRLAVAEAEMVRSRDALASADRALELMAESGSPPRERAEFLAAVAEALKLNGAEQQLWDPLIDRGLGLLAGERDALWARLTLLRDRYDYVRCGRVGSGIWSGQDRAAVAIAHGSDEESDYVRTLESLEWRTRMETDAVYQRAHASSRPLVQMRCLAVVVRDLVYRHGDFASARAAAEELLALAQRLGSVSAEAEARAQIAVCLLSVGDFDALGPRLMEAEQAIARLGPSHRLHLVPIGFSVGLGYFRDVDWRSTAITAAAYAGTPDAQRMSTGLVSAAYASLAIASAGRVADARAWLRDLTVASEKAPVTMYLFNWTLVAAAAAAWEIRFVEVASALRSRLADLDRLGAGPTTYGSVEHALARMSALVGAHDEACALFARAADRAERSGHEPLQAMIAYDRALAAERAGTADAQIRKDLDRALTAFEALGMRSWHVRARSLKNGATLSGAR